MKTLALLLVAGCMVPPQVPAAASPATAADRLAEELIEAANDARDNHDVEDLAVDATLMAAASDFAYELARRRTLTHTSHRAGYETLMDRIDRAGGAMVRAGENLASTSPRASMADVVIQLWLDSPGHRRNLLEPAYTHTGAAAVRGADNVWYFVQLYGVPASRRE